MAVRIGHASISERGTITGSAGDNNGREVYIKNWYLHPKKWVVLRCNDADKRKRIADAMEKACKNPDIGYDQHQRDTLFNNVKDKGFDPSKTTKKVETDCSALVRVCIAYAFGRDIAGNIRTVTEPSMLVKTGKFTKYTSDKYCKSSNFLRRGDILCTPVSGHTVVVLDDGANVSSSTAPTTSTTKPTTLNKTSKWEGIVIANTLNIRTGAGTSYSKCSFGPLKKNNVVSVCDSVKASDGATWYYVKYNGKYGFVHSSYVKKNEASVSVKTYKTTSDLNLRSVAGVIDKKNVLCVIPKGKSVTYEGKTKTVNGVKWYCVTYNGKTGYASSKYLK